jgi:hypothetical protein
MSELRPRAGLVLNLAAFLTGLASAVGLPVIALANLSYANTPVIAPGWLLYGLPTCVVILIPTTAILGIWGILRTGGGNRYWIFGVVAMCVVFLGISATFLIYVFYPGLD